MVDAQSTVSLVALSNSTVLATINTDLARMEKTNFSRGTELQWAGSRESSSFSARGGAFFLTSLLYRTQNPCSRRILANASAMLENYTFLTRILFPQEFNVHARREHPFLRRVSNSVAVCVSGNRESIHFRRPTCSVVILRTDGNHGDQHIGLLI